MHAAFFITPYVIRMSRPRIENRKTRHCPISDFNSPTSQNDDLYDVREIVDISSQCDRQ